MGLDVEDGEEAIEIWNAICNREQKAMLERGIPKDVAYDLISIAGDHWWAALREAWHGAAKSGGLHDV